MKNIIILAALGALFFSSCDGLLPRKISDESDLVEETSNEIKNDDMIEDLEFLQNYGEEADNDVSSLYAEHDLAAMILYDFYTERYFGSGKTASDRYLSTKLRHVLDGISEIESMTGFIILGYDPFICAQDITFREDQIEIERDGSSDWFTFSYGDKKVHLLMIEQNGDYLIDDVKLPNGSTITELYDQEKRNLY